jgi:hypothetical protein
MQWLGYIHPILSQPLGKLTKDSFATIILLRFGWQRRLSAPDHEHPLGSLVIFFGKDPSTRHQQESPRSNPLSEDRNVTPDIFPTQKKRFPSPPQLIVNFVQGTKDFLPRQSTFSWGPPIALAQMEMNYFNSKNSTLSISQNSSYSSR